MPDPAPSNIPNPSSTPQNPAPAPVTPTPAVQPSATPQTAANTPSDPTSANTFAVPEKYKDQTWAGKVKSPDDLWDQLANTQAVIGKKFLTPDWEKATPNELENYFKEVRPKDKNAYQFSKEADYKPTPLQEQLRDMLYNNGVPAYQGNKLIESYTAMEDALREEMFSEEGFFQQTETMFGKEYKTVVAEVDKFIKANANPELAKLLDETPNKYLAPVYGLMNNIRKAYGAQENGAAGNTPPSAPAALDLDKERVNVVNDIAALRHKPHTAEDKAALQKKLDDIDARRRKTNG